MDLTRVLPEEVLAEVLRRVAPQGLAVCRCACKALLAVIDARRLLRADLLPLSVGGIFINFYCEHLSEFFARPSTGRTISGRFDYVPHTNRPDWRKIKDHCNGLVLLGDHHEDYYVVNPATRQWDSLPPRPSVFEEINEDFTCQYHLVFDPMVSPHYEVFVILNPCYNEPVDGAHPVVILEEPESEWPPSVCDLHVFSSKLGGWKERSFIREGEAAGTLSGIRRHLNRSDVSPRHAVYCRGALYVHCNTDFVMRICLSSDKYQVIKPPMDCEHDGYQRLHLGRSEKGVCLVTIISETSRLMVWVLEESCDKTNWVLVHNNCLKPILDELRPVLGPWVLQDINFSEYLKKCKERNEHDDNLEWLMEKKLELNSSKKELLVEERIEWDSENDNILHKEDMGDGRVSGYIDILGFHPYKEIVFLDVSMCRGLAYHLKDSKVQDLGYLYPTTCHLALGAERFITDSFPYTPCWTGLQKATRM